MRILLVEDDPLIGDAIRGSFSRAGDTVDWITDGADASELPEIDGFDMMILDLGLPGKDGMDILQEIRGRGHFLPILILTARYEMDNRVRGLDLGADDYLVKPFAMEELMARCRALARRRETKQSHRLTYRDLVIDPAALTVSKSDRDIPLTPKVFGLLRLLLENQGRVLTRRTLEDHLYGWDGEAESNTLEVFISQIRRKLGADLIQTIRGVGYVLPKE
ncbi:response regulator transcription factor [Aestuariispira insulae]|uniref:Two-component system response regulator QseB n=1 Tax=Aestuariispira insulae TaxID=1461337 RepID=A0A3D9HFF0_9PROT|nr:response regulator transcription factor [Aestuariispira insulae]RED47696.1 two-component system response regulator QseB [Aestuariispira insulae]